MASFRRHLDTLGVREYRAVATSAVRELLSGRSALEIMIERARRTPGADLVACSIPELDAEDPLAEVALDAGAMVVRAPQAALLEGVRRAAVEADAGRVLHICGVQPFFDPVIAGGVLALLTDTRADIATNAAPALFPDGLDCEAVDAGLIAALAPGAVKTAKQLINAPGEDLLSRIAREGALFTEQLHSAEFKEAATAFMERRAPDFSKYG